ncbi:MAG: cytidylate kinase-like family protein [Bacteroidales bacterium]|nr:cytidylate kinase-like family protein [Bacteroidales bacterium]
MNTKEPFVITISRELGSGGRTVGRKLAAELNVRYSDKELVDQLMQKFNLTTSGIEQLKGKKKNWMAEFIQFVAPVPKVKMLVDTESKYVQEFRPDLTTDDLYKAESEILEGIAAEGSCVIAGRSGFFVLKDHPNKVDIFITASMEHRIERVMRKQQLSREEAEAAIKRVDEMRDNYVKRYTGTSRYDARNYDLTLNMDNISEDDAVKLILKFIKYS